MKRPRCKPDAHVDRPLRGGKRVRCTICGDVFPCRHYCDHADCREERGEPMPEGVELIAARGTTP